MSDIEKAIDWLSCDRDNYDTRDHAYYYLNLAVETLKNQINSGWVSVKERLPESDCSCLVITRNREIFISDFYGYGEEYQGFKQFPEGVWEINAYAETVIAWQELPEKYVELD